MNKERKEYSTLTLRLPTVMVDRIDHIVGQDGSNRTSWIRAAISRGLKNWTPPLENVHLWPPCQHCRERHDPKMAHGVDF